MTVVAIDGRGMAPHVTGMARGVVGLLALAMFINYVDRGNLATAAPLITDQLGLSNTEAGILLSSFYWTYTPGQLVAGWLTERINPYRTLAIGLGLWSFATAATGLAGGFMSLLILRLLLGAGESVTFPCNAKLLAMHLPVHKLGGANGLIGVGLAMRPAVGTFAGGLLMARFGWRPVFLLLGLVSALWLVPWLRATRAASRAMAPDPEAAAPSFLAILRRREAWGASLGHFAHNYSLYFVITWLPLYLVKARGLTVTEMAELGGLIYLIYAMSVELAGLFCDRWMRAGASGTRVRKTFCIVGHSGVTLCMIVCAAGSAHASIAALLASGVFFGCNSANIFAIGQTLGGPRGAGKWTGVQNCFGNMAGIAAPIVTGFVVDRTGAFTLAFAIAAAIGQAGVLGWGVIIPRIEALDWNNVR